MGFTAVSKLNSARQDIMKEIRFNSILISCIQEETADHVLKDFSVLTPFTYSPLLQERDANDTRSSQAVSLPSTNSAKLCIDFSDRTRTDVDIVLT